MSFKITGFFAFLLIALLTFLYFFEIPRIKEQRTDMENSMKVFPPLQHGSVIRMTLKQGDSLLVAAKEMGVWKIQKPVKTLGDRPELESLIRIVRSIEILQIIVDSVGASSNEINLKDFGLENPEVSLVIDQGEGNTDSIAFGEDSPMGFSYLKRSSKPGILAVPTWRKMQFKKSLLDLRDKRMLPMDMDLVKTFEYESNGVKIVASKRGLEWFLEHPVKDRGDDAMIQAFLNSMQSARVRGFAEEAAEDLTLFGLHRPWLALTLYEGERLTKKKVIFGDQIKPERLQRYYGKYESNQSVFIIDSTFVKNLKKTLFDFRFKEIFSFDRSGVDRVRLVTQEKTVDCRRVSSNFWSVIFPSQNTVRTGDIEDFLALIDNLKILRFVSETSDYLHTYGLDRSALQITVWKREDVVRKINIWEKDGHLYAKCESKPQVVEVDNSLLAWLIFPIFPVQADSTFAG